MAKSGLNPQRKRKLAGRRSSLPPYTLSSDAQLAAATQDRIKALERDKRFYCKQAVSLQADIDRLGPEVARLREALGRSRDSLANAEANNVYATVLIGVGGFLVSYASFTDKLARLWANLSIGLLLSGVGLLIWQSARRWRREFA